MTAVESAWPRYPGYRIDLTPLDGIGRAYLGDVLVAESSACLLVRESDHVDQLYFPLDDLTVPLIESKHHTVCPFKGEASYASIEVEGRVEADVLWWYADPMDEVTGLAGHGAFWDDRVALSFSVLFASDVADGPARDAAVTVFPAWGTAGDLVGLVDARPTSDDHGRAIATLPPYPDPPLGTFFDWARDRPRRNVVEGGQLLGAAVATAARLRPDLTVTTATMAFTRAADFDAPVEVVAETTHDGASVASWSVQATQRDRVCASGTVLALSRTVDVVAHADPIPDVPSPADCPRLDFGVIGRELRVVDGAYPPDPSTEGPPELHVWTRFADDPGDVALHQALLAQSSTHWTIGAALRPHRDISEADAHVAVSMGILSATISFHGRVDVTGWLLTETRSIHVGGGTTQAQSRTWTAEGTLVASASVLGVIRPFARPPDEIGKDASTAM